jgi:uncharacterized protein YecT (DUF1311 family)
MRNLLLFLLLLFVPATLNAQNSSVPQTPCDDEGLSQMEMNDCAAVGYKQAEADLNKVYRKAMHSMSEDVAEAQEEGNHLQIKCQQTGIPNLKKAEPEWLSYRRIQCDATAQRYEGGSMMLMTYSQCLKTLTDERIADLKSIYDLDRC